MTGMLKSETKTVAAMVVGVRDGHAHECLTQGAKPLHFGELANPHMHG